MTTFSQLVDEITTELVRPDMRDSIVGYANATIRELHSRKGNSEPILFGENRIEDEFEVLALPALWPIPSAPRFQRLETIYDPIMNRYWTERALSKLYDPHIYPFWWYRTGPNFAITNVTVGQILNLAWFEFPRLLTYYPEATPQVRPAVYDPAADSYTYAAAYDVSDETRENARNLSTNWILLRWGELVVKAGIRAKVYSRMGDVDRSRIHYSAFETIREQMNASEEWQQNQL